MADRKLLLALLLICTASGAVVAAMLTKVDAPPLAVLGGFLCGFCFSADAALSH